MYVDSHCHINFPQLAGQLPSVLKAMAENRVTHALCIGVNLPELPGVLALAAEHSNIFASVGVHPDYEETPDPSVDDLLALVAAYVRAFQPGLSKSAPLASSFLTIET
ncbi:MAG: hypothetical protein E6H74_11375 [Betaproteobacteria bacterium]|nr:MAG: hypothetical protein E6H74_11375 [Betaproteobacteria bacterium]